MPESALLIDNTPLERPLNGLELKRWFTNIIDLKRDLRSLLAKRALVCLSPNRSVRCDAPATGIFWQDQAEWYPCCDAHWPRGQMWTGSTRFHSGFITLNCFEERLDPGDLREKVEKYRTDAT